MDHDGDFSAYASARWGSLVRSAVFLGCSLDEAHDLVQTTLLRCYTAWQKVAKADNREVVVLRYYAHLSEQETAEALGIAAGTVKSRLSRALTQLAANDHLADLAEGTP
ncbi:MAG: sigma factor-like helix-turn-helix DNA-binding protein [Nocardioidaceae bacterium]